MKEKNLHLQVCKYLDAQYPGVIYTSDPSGLRLSMGLRMEVKRKRCKRYKIPDLIILCPAGTFSGLIMEIKTDVSEVYTKTGELRRTDHVAEQAETLRELSNLGYAAFFGCGFDHCKKIIDDYFKL